MSTPIAPGEQATAEGACSPGSTPRTWTIEFEPGTPILTANQRMHRYARNDRTQELKVKTAMLAKRMRIPALERADVTTWYASPPRQKAQRHPLASDALDDSDGLAPTGKACLDGLVLGGVFVTDRKRCVRRTTCELAGETHPRGQLCVIITEVTGGAP